MNSFASEIEWLRRKVSENPASMLHARLAERYLRMRELDRAVEHAERSVVLFPHYTTARFVLAKCYYEREQFDLANKNLKELLAVDSHHPTALKLAVEISRRLGDIARLKQLLRRLYEIDPLNREVMQQLRELDSTAAGGPAAAPAPSAPLSFGPPQTSAYSPAAGTTGAPVEPPSVTPTVRHAPETPTSQPSRRLQEFLEQLEKGSFAPWEEPSEPAVAPQEKTAEPSLTSGPFGAPQDTDWSAAPPSAGPAAPEVPQDLFADLPQAGWGAEPAVQPTAEPAAPIVPQDLFADLPQADWSAEPAAPPSAEPAVPSEMDWKGAIVEQPTWEPRDVFEMPPAAESTSSSVFPEDWLALDDAAKEPAAPEDLLESVPHAEPVTEEEPTFGFPSVPQSENPFEDIYTTVSAPPEEKKRETEPSLTPEPPAEDDFDLVTAQYREEESRFTQLLDDIFSSNIDEEEESAERVRSTVDRLFGRDFGGREDLSEEGPTFVERADLKEKPTELAEEPFDDGDLLFEAAKEETGAGQAAEGSALHTELEEIKKEFEDFLAELDVRDDDLLTGAASAGAASREPFAAEPLEDWESLWPPRDKEDVRPPAEDRVSIAPKPAPVQPRGSAEEPPIDEEEKSSRPKGRFVTPTLGEIYAAQGQYTKAISVFETLIKNDPTNESYRQKLAFLKQKAAEQSSAGNP